MTEPFHHQHEFVTTAGQASSPRGLRGNRAVGADAPHARWLHAVVHCRGASGVVHSLSVELSAARGNSTVDLWRNQHAGSQSTWIISFPLQSLHQAAGPSSSVGTQPSVGLGRGPRLEATNVTDAPTHPQPPDTHGPTLSAWDQRPIPLPDPPLGQALHKLLSISAGKRPPVCTSRLP